MAKNIAYYEVIKRLKENTIRPRPQSHETTYVVVLNYTTNSVKFYKLNEVEDVETWLKDHTDYNDSNCYYMTSPKPFEIKIDDVVN